jgi:hypothetical protein
VIRRAVTVRPAAAAWRHAAVTLPDGTTAWLINPALPIGERARCQALAAKVGVKAVDLGADPKLRGVLLEEALAERHRTIRWHFPWGPYVVIGEPDGITDDLIYEFKTSRSRYLGGQLLPVALAQADLYGTFFGRPRKRVQLHIVEEGVTETWASPVDRAAAEAVLERFRGVAEGVPVRPPREAWKCRRCDVRPWCPICPQAGSPASV